MIVDTVGVLLCTVIDDVVVEASATALAVELISATGRGVATEAALNQRAFGPS